MKNKPRHIVITTLCLIVLIAIIYAFLPQPHRVETAHITRAPLAVTLIEEGHTRVAERYVISAPINAYAQRLELDVGDIVQEDQALVMLEPTRSSVLDPRSHLQAHARVNAAQAALEAAQQHQNARQAEADLADLNYLRIKELCQRQCASREEEDQAEAQARSAKANYQAAQAATEVARHELEIAQATLDESIAEDHDRRIAIRSPVDGRVLKLHHESEGSVTTGTPLLEIGDPRNLEISVDVLSADAVRLFPGMKVEINRWGGDHPLQGQVRLIEPSGFTKVSALGVEEQRVNAIIDITSEASSWQTLGDGFRVEAHFFLWEKPAVLQVPTAALFRDDKQWAVFKIVDERIQKNYVEIGQRNGLAAEVISGLDETATVIIYPERILKFGDRVSEF